jgi:hypothetical protein
MSILRWNRPTWDAELEHEVGLTLQANSLPTALHDVLIPLLRWAHAHKFEEPWFSAGTGGFRLVLGHSKTGRFSPISAWRAGSSRGIDEPVMQVHIDLDEDQIGSPDPFRVGLAPAFSTARRQKLRARIEEVMAPFDVPRNSNGPELPFSVLRSAERLEHVLDVIDRTLFGRPK